MMPLADGLARRESPQRASLDFLTGTVDLFSTAALDTLEDLAHAGGSFRMPGSFAGLTALAAAGCFRLICVAEGSRIFSIGQP